MSYKDTALVFGGLGFLYPGMFKEFSRHPAGNRVYREARSAVGFIPWYLVSNGLFQHIKAPRNTRIPGYNRALDFLGAPRNVSLQDWILADPRRLQFGTLAGQQAMNATLMHDVPELEFRVMTGYSNGIYSAACAAGVLSLSDAFLMVYHSGRFIKNASKKGKGGLIVLRYKGQYDIHPKLAQLEEHGFHGVYLAIDQSPTVKIFGVNDKVDDVVDFFNQDLEFRKVEGVAKRISGVNTPLHTPYMKDPADMVRDYLTKRIEARTAKNRDERIVRLGNCNVIAPTSAKVIADPQDLLDEAVNSIYNPIKWTDTIRRMTGEFGIARYVVIDVDQKRPMEKSIRAIYPNEQQVEILSIHNRQSLEQVVQNLSLDMPSSPRAA